MPQLEERRPGAARHHASRAGVDDDSRRAAPPRGRGSPGGPAGSSLPASSTVDQVGHPDQVHALGQHPRSCRRARAARSVRPRLEAKPKTGSAVSRRGCARRSSHQGRRARGAPPRGPRPPRLRSRSSILTMPMPRSARSPPAAGCMTNPAPRRRTPHGAPLPASACWNPVRISSAIAQRPCAIQRGTNRPGFLAPERHLDPGGSLRSATMTCPTGHHQVLGRQGVVRVTDVTVVTAGSRRHIEAGAGWRRRGRSADDLVPDLEVDRQPARPVD